MNDPLTSLISWATRSGYWPSLFFVCTAGTCLLFAKAFSEKTAGWFFEPRNKKDRGDGK